jgi:aspartate racemase
MEIKNKKVVGILGGMGPAATADLLKKIIQLTPAKVDEDHLNIQIDCNPIPGAKKDSLCARAARLENLGAELIAIPCNSAHAYIDAIQSAVHIQVINMITEAVNIVSGLNPAVRNVGVLAWHEALTSGLYQRELSARGYTPIIPSQAEIPAISNLIIAIKDNNVKHSDRDSAIQVGRELLKRGAEAVVLGCTELPLSLSQDDFDVPVIDATLALAQSVVKLAIGK